MSYHVVSGAERGVAPAPVKDDGRRREAAGLITNINQTRQQLNQAASTPPTVGGGFPTKWLIVGGVGLIGFLLWRRSRKKGRK